MRGMAPGRDKPAKIVWLLVASGLVIVMLAGLVVFLLIRSHKNNGDDSQASQRILREVGELYVLPAGEQPTVAEIRDTSKLPQQEFFSRARKGDFLLVYPKAKIALLYRESLHKLIQVAPVTMPQSTSGTNTAQ